jgi:hypothetical protein
VELAIADYKQKYGDKAVAKDISIESADHQNKPDVANAKAAELYDRKQVDAILDVPTSSAALKVADVAKEKKKLYFNISAATTDLTGKSCNKYTFHYAYDTYMLANGTGRPRPTRREDLVPGVPRLPVRAGHDEVVRGRGDEGRWHGRRQGPGPVPEHVRRLLQLSAQGADPDP